MKNSIRKLKSVFLTITILTVGFTSVAQKNPDLKVVAFYTGKNDQAHISFVNEANIWFSETGKKEHFTDRKSVV